ncbi:hypothetical protein EVAR_103247_1 [Eumeta japonica]|uniref:Uncharacterized protein n=1 Tax=Eumeta variegata TaxID=151549 RepID=A0A4C1X693_EUMVA|nr:hypothetical protein EVAR_103247_1 [Eumeta japonica]
MQILHRILQLPVGAPNLNVKEHPPKMTLARVAQQRFRRLRGLGRGAAVESRHDHAVCTVRTGRGQTNPGNDGAGMAHHAPSRHLHLTGGLSQFQTSLVTTSGHHHVDFERDAVRADDARGRHACGRSPIRDVVRRPMRRRRRRKNGGSRPRREKTIKPDGTCPAAIIPGGAAPRALRPEWRRPVCVISIIRTFPKPELYYVRAPKLCFPATVPKSQGAEIRESLCF